MATEYILFSNVCEKFSKIYHMIEHKQILANLRRLKTYKLFSDHNVMKLKINKKKAEKFINM